MPRTRSLAWSELKIGLVSVFALVIAALVIFMVSGEGGFFWQRYNIKSVFPDIEGKTIFIHNGINPSDFELTAGTPKASEQRSHRP